MRISGSAGHRSVVALLAVMGAVVVARSAVAAGAATADDVPVVSMSPVTGLFFPNTSNSTTFGARPGMLKAFSQSFPVLDFNPPAALAPCATAVGPATRPFTDVVPRADGTCATLVAQGGGFQAGVGALGSFFAVFAGRFTVSGPGRVRFDVHAPDGWILSIDRDWASGGVPAYVSGPQAGAPAAGAWLGYPVVGACNGAAPCGDGAVVVDFPAAGTYGFELDDTECCGGELSLVLAANGVPLVRNATVTASAGPGGVITPSGTLSVPPHADVDFAIAAFECHHVVDVVVDGASVGAVTAWRLADVTANHTVTASFAADPAPVIAAAAGPHGAISPAGAVPVGCGGAQAFTVTPAARCTTADVVVDGASIGAVARYEFPFVTGPHTIVATFAPLNAPPDCAGARADVVRLWPPDGAMAPVAIGGVTDPDGDAVAVTVTSVASSEPTGAGGCPDAVIVDGRAELRRERAGAGGGRVYLVRFTATDGRGGACDGAVTVCVPHDARDAGGAAACTGGGPWYDAVAACDSRRAGRTAATGQVAITAAAAVGAACTLDYALPQDGDVSIVLYDVAGRRMRTLLAEPQSAGDHRLDWNAAGLGRGMYFVHVRAGATTVARAVLVP